ncbi:MAG TPA: nuclear transport factor 2 family protein [Thermodesulfobacteriota bacterium]|nr:nuclear transport factor 2 family protein [Thermodesulfobacteriota bacterium]
MRHICIMCVIILAASSLALGQTKSQKAGKDSGIAQEVKGMIAKYREALMRRDVAALDRIWSDDYLFTNADGVLLTKAQRIANVKSGATGFESIKSNEDEFKLRVYGDVVVVNSHVTLKGQYSGKKTSGQFRSIQVWVRRGGSWQLAAHQMTRIAQP